jgi:hypothetical protein
MALDGDGRHNRGLENGNTLMGDRDHSACWIDRTNYSGGVVLYIQVSNGHVIRSRELTGHAAPGNELSCRTQSVGFEALQAT